MTDLSKDAHDLIAGLDPASASIVAGMIVAEAAPPTAVIAKAYSEWVTGEAEALRRSVIRQFVSKRAAGEPVGSLVELSAAISKASMGFGPASAWEEQQHRRDPKTGMFVVMHKPIKIGTHVPFDDADEDGLNIPHPDTQVGWTPRKLSDRQRSAYQQAYLQVARSVERYRDLPPGMAVMRTQYTDGSHSERSLDADTRINVIPDRIVRHVQVQVKAPEMASHDPRATTFDAVRAVTGNPRFAAHLATTKLPMDSFLNDMPEQPGEEYTSAASFRRMRAGADLLTAAAGPFMPAPAAMATRTASFVGQYGPQAQQVFGPAIDRAKYRYKGTERKLDPKVTAALGAIKRKYPDPDVAREKMTYGSVETTAPGRPGGRIVEEWRPSPLVSYLKDQLPKQKLAALQRMSGRIPPSQGVIIDRQGRVSAQMVGVGDDWYLPFNLKNLGSLQGGEYLRTRTNGGLTTEDMYTGLMAGARSMTVVSHNGVYTMEFDDTLRGSRRYSSTAREMTERYGQLLDAVKSGKVPANDLDPSVYQEIRERVGARMNPGQPGYDEAIQDEIAAARDNPQPSQAMQAEWMHEFLEDRASRMATRSGAPMSVSQMVNEKVIGPYAARLAQQRNDAIGTTVYTGKEVDLQDEALQQYESNPKLAVAMLDGTTDFNKFMSNKTRAYVDSTRPMSLNGPGYEFAMDALKEQYPYFIAKTKFTPWSDTEPDAGLDHGYVKPRFNRPADVQAGYYDQTILGHGKRSADKVRYQNFGVMQRLGQSHESRGGDGDGGGNPVAPSRERGRPAITPMRPAPTPTAPGVSPQRTADMALVHHILGQQTLSENTKLADADGTFAGEPVGGMKAGWMRGEHPSYGTAFQPLTKSPAEFEALDDDALHAQAAALLALNDEHTLFDLDPSIVARHARRGAAPATQALTADAVRDSALKENHDNEYDLGAEFAPGRARSQYAATLAQNVGGTQDTMGAAAIDDLDDPEFAGKLTDYQLELRDHMLDPASEYPVADLLADGRSAVALRQLHRRYHETTPPVVGGSAGGVIAPIKFSGSGDLGLAGGPSIGASYTGGMLRPMYPTLGVSRLGGSGLSAN